MLLTITGKNIYDIKQFVSAAVGKFINKYSDIGYQKIDASQYSADNVIQAVQTQPFLTEKKLIIITDINQNQELLSRIKELSERAIDSVDVYFVDSELDKRKTYYRDILKYTAVKEFKLKSIQNLPQWVVDIAKNNKAVISLKNAQYLVDRVGQNQLILENEIKKLSLYNSDISVESISILTDENVNSSIFGLIDAIFAGDSKRAMILYRQQREQQVEPLYIVSMITWQLQNLALTLFSKNQDYNELQAAGLSRFTVQKTISLAKKIDKNTIKNYVQKLVMLDYDLKTKNIDSDSAFELFIADSAIS